MVTTKGERYQLVKKDEAEDMKKTYVNLKPARKYRFHWWRIQSRESSYWPYCLHFNLFCILSKAAGFFIYFCCPLQWVEGDICLCVSGLFFNFSFLFFYHYICLCSNSGVFQYFMIFHHFFSLFWNAVIFWWGYVVNCALWSSRAYLLLPSQLFWCCTDILNSLIFLICILLNLVQDIYIFIIMIISKVICHICK